MKRIFRIEKILIHNDNMDLMSTKTRVKFFGIEIKSFQTPINKNQLITA